MAQANAPHRWYRGINTHRVIGSAIAVVLWSLGMTWLVVYGVIGFFIFRYLDFIQMTDDLCHVIDYLPLGQPTKLQFYTLVVILEDWHLYAIQIGISNSHGRSHNADDLRGHVRQRQARAILRTQSGHTILATPAVHGDATIPDPSTHSHKHRRHHSKKSVRHVALQSEEDTSFRTNTKLTRAHRHGLKKHKSVSLDRATHYESDDHHDTEEAGECDDDDDHSTLSDDSAHASRPRRTENAPECVYEFEDAYQNTPPLVNYDAMVDLDMLQPNFSTLRADNSNTIPSKRGAASQRKHVRGVDADRTTFNDTSIGFIDTILSMYESASTVVGFMGKAQEYWHTITNYYNAFHVPTSSSNKQSQSSQRRRST